MYATAVTLSLHPHPSLLPAGSEMLTGVVIGGLLVGVWVLRQQAEGSD